MEWLLDNIVSILAVMAAYWAGWYSKMQTDLNKKGLELEEQREQERIEEAKKATIVPRMTTGVARSGKTKFLLSVFNEGKSEARNVRIFINEETPKECSHILTDENNVKVIGPSTKFDFIIAKSKDTEPQWTVKVVWDDDFEKNRKSRTILKV